MKTNTRNPTRLAAIFAIVCAALLAGCGSAPPKHEMRNMAMNEVKDAEAVYSLNFGNGYLVRDKSGQLWIVNYTTEGPFSVTPKLYDVEKINF